MAAYGRESILRFPKFRGFLEVHASRDSPQMQCEICETEILHETEIWSHHSEAESFAEFGRDVEMVRSTLRARAFS